MRPLMFLTFLVLLLPAAYTTCPGQNPAPGKLVVVQDERINVLMQKHIQYNENKHGIPGYRVQIFFDSGNNSKRKAQSVYTEFLTNHPGTEAYIIFQEPNYKVRVGDFRTRMDAEGFMRVVLNEYPNAYCVKDIINYPKIN